MSTRSMELLLQLKAPVYSTKQVFLLINSVFYSLFKTAKCPLFAEMTTFTNMHIVSLVDY